MSLRKPALLALAVLAALISWSAAAVFPVSADASATRGVLLPPANPPYSLGVGQYNPPGCAAVTDFSGTCSRESLAMINAGRQAEGLGPLMLPSNWQGLTVAQQLYVLTELERSARGLPIDSGLSALLNDAAVSGADAGRDPSGSGIAALWAGGEPNSIVVMADWLYEDGLFADGSAENLNCTTADPSGCWQHRDILLHDGAPGSCGSRCAVGAGYSPSGYGGGAGTGTGSDSYTEVFAPGASGVETFTWAAELPQLPPCEQTGDSCGWTGSPVATTSGIKTVGAGSSHAPTNTRPWFATSVTFQVDGLGLALRIHPGIRLRRVTVVAHRRGGQIVLRVRRLSRYRYTATGRLHAGTWTVRIRYWTLRTGWRRPTSAMPVTVS